MPKHPYDLLSLSVSVLRLGVCSALVAVGFVRLLETALLVPTTMNLWLLALSTTQRGEEGNLSFGTFSWGLILVTGGLMGFLYLRNVYKAIFIPTIPIVISLSIVAVLRSRGNI